jgi:putative ABC transport system permease protein
MSKTPKDSIMIKNFFTIAFRQIVKNKTYSFINIGGLGIGLACCIAIGLYIADELSYDRFHPNKNIYRVIEEQEQAGIWYPVAVTPGVLAKELRHDFPQIEEICRIGRFWLVPVLTTDEKSIEANDVLVADNSLFRMFQFPLLVGDPTKALQDMNDIVLSEKLAISLFGSNWRSKNILGKQLALNNDRILTIAAVAANAPDNSHIQFQALLSMKYDEATSDNFGWRSNNYHTYIAVRPDADINSLKSTLLHFIDKFTSGRSITLGLQHLHDIHLHSDFAFETDWSKRSNVLYINIFLAVGAIVLLIAVFNFINLCTARAMNRAKEVGVRKVVGAVHRQLIVQFLTETFIMTALAITFALFVLQLCLPFLNDISGKSLIVPFDSRSFIALILLAVFVLTFLAGLYPAFYLSVFKPAKVLKGVFTMRSGTLFRKSLVVMQFTFSVILIIGTMVIYKQLIFLQNKNLGFDKERLIDVALKNNLRKEAHLMKRDLENESSIAGATVITANLVDNNNSTGGIEWEGKSADDKILLTHLSVDPDFLSTTAMSLVAGRNFDLNIASDTISAFILNESAVKRMGWTSEKAIGKKIVFWGTDGYVIGVVKDFHYKPMTNTIGPILLRYWPRSYNSSLIVKAQANRVSEAINVIEKIYKKYDSQTSPSYQFIDQVLQNQYKLEQNTGRIVMCFSILAIIVSSLGLFGLATHTAEQRTKEIGVRKVLGASVSSIVNLLSRDFLKLVFISILLATPVAWWSMNKWLAAFAYKISIDWWIFFGAAAGVLAVAMFTVSSQSLKAALMNPVKTLRSE